MFILAVCLLPQQLVFSTFPFDHFESDCLQYKVLEGNNPNMIELN